MIKAVTLIRRKRGMTFLEFQDYWLQRHAVVIRRLPGIRRYVQNHPLPEHYDDRPPPYDGIAELWGDDTRAFRDMAASTAYQRVQADEEQFIDRSRMDLLLTSEIVLRDGAVTDGGVKLIDLLRRGPEWTVAAFQQYWRDQHGPLVLGLPAVRKYVQSPVRPGGYSAEHAPVCDGLSSMWFDSTADWGQTASTPAYAAVVADMANFTAADGHARLICRERLIVG